MVDEGEGWALTHFDKTLLTPEGWDVYARSPQRPDVDAVLARHGVPPSFEPRRTEA